MVPMSGDTPVGDDLTSAGLTPPDRTLVAGGRRQVSESAAKEYQIEEALTKMESEWTDCHLEIVGYRETGTGVLKGVDDINAVLDEQVSWNRIFGEKLHGDTSCESRDAPSMNATLCENRGSLWGRLAFFRGIDW